MEISKRPPYVLRSKHLRRGKWDEKEELYTATIISYFRKGLLFLDHGITLRQYLANALHCDPMRITKKFAGDQSIGKCSFAPISMNTLENDDDIEQAKESILKARNAWYDILYEEEQEQISKKIDFLKAKRLTNNKMDFFSEESISNALHPYLTESDLDSLIKWITKASNSFENCVERNSLDSLITDGESILEVVRKQIRDKCTSIVSMESNELLQLEVVDDTVKSAYSITSSSGCNVDNYTANACLSSKYPPFETSNQLLVSPCMKTSTASVTYISVPTYSYPPCPTIRTSVNREQYPHSNYYQQQQQHLPQQQHYPSSHPLPSYSFDRQSPYFNVEREGGGGGGSHVNQPTVQQQQQQPPDYLYPIPTSSSRSAIPIPTPASIPLSQPLHSPNYYHMPYNYDCPPSNYPPHHPPPLAQPPPYIYTNHQYHNNNNNYANPNHHNIHSVLDSSHDTMNGNYYDDGHPNSLLPPPLTTNTSRPSAIACPPHVSCYPLPSAPSPATTTATATNNYYPIASSYQYDSNSKNNNINYEGNSNRLIDEKVVNSSSSDSSSSSRNYDDQNKRRKYDTSTTTITRDYLRNPSELGVSSSTHHHQYYYLTPPGGNASYYSESYPFCTATSSSSINIYNNNTSNNININIRDSVMEPVQQIPLPPYSATTRNTTVPITTTTSNTSDVGSSHSNFPHYITLSQSQTQTQQLPQTQLYYSSESSLESLTSHNDIETKTYSWPPPLVTSSTSQVVRFQDELFMEQSTGADEGSVSTMQSDEEEEEEEEEEMRAATTPEFGDDEEAISYFSHCRILVDTLQKVVDAEELDVLSAILSLNNKSHFG